MGLREEKFWDDHYALELRNYEEDGDEGDIWFGKKLSREIVNHVIEQIANSDSYMKQTVTIIDIGCGNGFLLCEIAKSYNDRFGSHKNLKLMGLDYSENSIRLSSKIVQNKSLSHVINLEKCDFLDVDKVLHYTKPDKFKFIIDKGTYDAICLLASDSKESLQKSKLEYLKSIYSLISQDSIFILASCNNTQDELEQLMNIECQGRAQHSLIGQIKTPTISFGGKSGSQVTCLIFKFDVS